MKRIGYLGVLVLIVAASESVLVHAETQKRNRPVPIEHWTPEAQLMLARAWVGEADWSEQDHIAIGWVLAKRWAYFNQSRSPENQLDFAAFTQAYSAALKGETGNKTPRQKIIQQLPWGDPVSGVYSTPMNVKRWKQVRERVKRWGEGEIDDPCRSAMHWGGTMDHPPANWEPVSCGDTWNIFYRVKVHRARRVQQR